MYARARTHTNTEEISKITGRGKENKKEKELLIYSLYAVSYTNRCLDSNVVLDLFVIVKFHLLTSSNVLL